MAKEVSSNVDEVQQTTDTNVVYSKPNATQSNVANTKSGVELEVRVIVVVLCSVRDQFLTRREEIV